MKLNNKDDSPFFFCLKTIGNEYISNLFASILDEQAAFKLWTLVLTQDFQFI